MKHIKIGKTYLNASVFKGLKRDEFNKAIKGIPVDADKAWKAMQRYK